MLFAHVIAGLNAAVNRLISSDFCGSHFRLTSAAANRRGQHKNPPADFKHIVLRAKRPAVLGKEAQRDTMRVVMQRAGSISYCPRQAPATDSKPFEKRTARSGSWLGIQ